MKSRFVFVVSLFLAASASATPELKGSPEELREFLHPSEATVQIKGEAEETAFSDTAIIFVVVTTEDKQLSVAIAENANLRAEIASTLVAAGIPAANINSSKFSTSPQYGWFGKKPSSYKVINRMAIEIDNGELLRQIAAVADSRDEINLADTTFKHSRKAEFEKKVREKALSKVMADKEFYEKKLNVKLTPVRFSDGSIESGGARDAMALEEIVVTTRKRSEDLQEVPISVSAYSSAGPSSFDEIEYKTTVTVIFRIEPVE